MNVASLELCKELYELSGWDDTELLPDIHYYFSGHGAGFAYDRSHFSVGSRSNATEYPPKGVELKVGHLPEPPEKRTNYVIAPAYDCGYLLRKLPRSFMDVPFVLTIESKFWWCGYKTNTAVIIDTDADTPEDALCKLAIELFKQGVLATQNRKDKAE